MRSSAQPEQPRLFLLDAEALMDVRRRLCHGDEDLSAADDRLLHEASNAVDAGPFSVVDKTGWPPGGDRHDYASLNPNLLLESGAHAEGSNFQAAGEENTDTAVGSAEGAWDRSRLGAFCSSVNTLCLAYFLSDHQEFADHAALLLRTWFLSESTRMHPHMSYAGGIPEQREVEHRSLVEGLPLTWLIDSVGLLAESNSWSSEDQRDLEKWYAQYLQWLLESEIGQRQSLEQDYHGTLYDLQIASIAYFVGEEDVGADIMRVRARQRIDLQIGADGSQPKELAHDRTLDSCVTNLIGLFDLATLAGRVGLDLWTHDSTSGGSIRKSFYWLVEAAIDQAWPFRQIIPFDRSQLLPLLRRGSNRFQDPECEARLRNLQGVCWSNDRTNLLYPPLEATVS